ncbi:MAG TPA: glycosyltransferase family 2 protein [Patescibacteria group bacterium]|nr:glycosyltransferase family 2 protein [Patescibacteria group bacterium]
MKRVDLSIIILNFNTVDVTRACLSSIRNTKLGGYTIEVIVCDNASSDGSQTMVKKEFPEVTFIENGKNIGFAAGNNPGIKGSKGRYILLLNSDTEVAVNTFTSMITFMDGHPKAGAATCKLVLPDGSMDPACHRGFPTPWVAFSYIAKLEKLFPRTQWFGEYHQGYKDLRIPHEVDCISGAFFMVRREVVAAVGVLDEDYFMYAEDIDWAYRIKQAGWQIWYYPLVSILHKKKQSGRANILRQRRVATEIYFHEYNWLFFKKHYAREYGPIISFLVNSFYVFRLFLLKQWSL